MLLRNYCLAYLSSRDVSNDHRRQLGWTVDRFARFLLREPELSDLADATINRWLDDMLAVGLSRRTVRNQRTNLLCLWRSAHFEGLVSVGPVRVKRIKCPRLIPSAAPLEKVNALLTEAAKTKGRFQRSKVSRPAFWRALILFIWETGLRLGDVLRIELSQIEDGVLVLAQNKTGWPLIRPLSTECLAAIEAIDPDTRERIFGGALSRNRVMAGFKVLALAAGFNGGTKKIRKSGATAIEAICPGAAKDYLGHKTYGLAYTYYVDPRLLHQSRPTPPPLTA